MNIVRTILLEESQFYQEHGKKATDLWVGPQERAMLDEEAIRIVAPPFAFGGCAVYEFAGLTVRDMRDEGIRVGISVEAKP